MLRLSVTADPGTTAAGTTAFTWYNPTIPGVKPAKLTTAGNPPMVTVGANVVLESGVATAAAPLAG
jgi:hypothetical protein